MNATDQISLPNARPGATLLNRVQLWEYIAEDGDFALDVHGLRVRFIPQPKYDGRRIIEVDRADVAHFFDAYSRPSSMNVSALFARAEELEQEIDDQEKLAFFARNETEIRRLLHVAKKKGPSPQEKEAEATASVENAKKVLAPAK